MNKNELIESVANASGLSKKDSGEAIDAMLNVIKDTLAKGDEVRLVGFGTFAVTARAASQGRNPRTGAAITIPASKQPKFRAGAALKQAVN